jgi:hypothetical protein
LVASIDLPGVFVLCGSGVHGRSSSGSSRFRTKSPARVPPLKVMVVVAVMVVVVVAVIMVVVVVVEAG